MTINKLAIEGGPKTIKSELVPYRSIGNEEVLAATKVLKSGVLSQYVASFSDGFMGGIYVKELEKTCEEMFGVKNAIAVNSWTSGLVCAVGSLDVEPGDEIIVTPWTMSATVAAILNWGCIPVFADIDKTTFTIIPERVEELVSEKTRAILVADIFGQSANYEPLIQLAQKFDLKIVSDTAQAPYAKTSLGFAGTIADIGGISLNYHKHIHCGEGGVIFTNDDDLALRMRLIRNHAECCVSESGMRNLSNMIGYNFRLGEIEAAIAIEQLKKLPRIISRRQEIAQKLSDAVNDLEGLLVPKPISSNEHVYYVLPIIFDPEKFTVPRDKFVEHLIAEGAYGFSGGYINCHKLPALEKKIAYGKKGFPWSLNPHIDYRYGSGTCPNAEYLNDTTCIIFEMCMFELSDPDVELIIQAIKKVHEANSKLNAKESLVTI